MGRCSACGILMNEEVPLRCYRYGTKLTEAEAGQERDCPYFCEPIYDEGERLSPAELVLLKEQDMKFRRMQGPV